MSVDMVEGVILLVRGGTEDLCEDKFVVFNVSFLNKT